METKFQKQREAAIKCYGQQIVDEVVMLVDLFDEDGAYSAFQDQAMDEHAECLSMMFYE